MQYEANKRRLNQFMYLKNDFICINNFKIKEYYPMVNPRAHMFGKNKENIFC